MTILLACPANPPRLTPAEPHQRHSCNQRVLQIAARLSTSTGKRGGGTPRLQRSSCLPEGITDTLIGLRALRSFTLLLLLSFVGYRAPAQVIPAFRLPPRIAVFATYNDVKPDFRYYGDLAVDGGFGLGGFYQTRHVIGAELRGSINRWGGLEHEETVLAGPRAALHIRHLFPYVSILGGEANAWRWSNPPIKGEPTPTLIEGRGPQWSVLGGLDVHFNHHLSFRTGELSYAKTYLKGWNMTPLSASAGVVYRIN